MADQTTFPPRLLIEHVRDELRQHAESPTDEWGTSDAIARWLSIQADNLDEAIESLPGATVSLRHAFHSHQRVAALAELSHRYGAIISGLAHAIGDALPHVDKEARPELDEAVETAESQVAAADIALSAAFAALPESGGE